MKILKIIGVGVGALVALFLIVMLFLPSDVHVERSIVINASSAKVFGEINSLKNFNDWNPWADIDPDMINTYEGPDEGVGCKNIWQSDHPDVGSGAQWIVESIPNSKVVTNLEFEGYEDISTAFFDLQENEEGTQVTWGFDAEMSGIGKYMGLMMDGWLGPSYEKGLGQLKEIVESKPDYSIEIVVEEIPGMTFLGIKREMQGMEGISEAMGEMYGQLMGQMQQFKLEATGMPLAVYHDWSEEGFTMECGIPVAEGTDIKSKVALVSTTPAGNTLKAIHMGDYSKLGDSHMEVEKFMKDNELAMAGSAWEVYVTDPGQESDTTEWITEIYYPLGPKPAE